jgi:hypothetical protein
MLPLWWRRLRSVRSTTRARSTPHPSLTLEALECRDVPAVTLVSAADPSFMSSSSTANGQSETSPVDSLSADGRYLVYISTGYNLVPNQTRNNSTTTQNVYLYDTATGTSTLISHDASSATENGNGASFDPVISADGSTVAFYSTATDLIAGDDITSGTVQLYLYDVSTGGLTLVTADSTTATDGSDGTAPSIPSTPSNSYNAVNTLGYSTDGGGLALPALSSNGQYVGFISDATDLGYTMPAASTGDPPITEVFLYDRSQNTITLVSHEDSSTTTGASSSVGDSYASTVAISGDGSTVAFTTPFDNLISGESVDGVDDNLYVWSRINNAGVTGLTAGETVLASHEYGSADTGAAIPSSEELLFGFTGDSPATLSTNGAYVAYYDAGDNLVDNQAGTASVLNVYRYDVANNVNALVTHVYGTTATDLATAGNNPPNAVAPYGFGPAEATGPQISSDGTYIAYANNSDDLVTSSPFTAPGGGTYDGADQVYLYDASTGVNTLVSHADGSATTPSATGGTAPAMSSNGQYVSYIDWAYPAHGTATAAVGNVRIYNSQASATAIPTAVGTAFDTSIQNAAEISSAILAPTVMSANGQMIVWDGSSTSNVSNDNNSALDVFLVNQAPTPTQLTLNTVDVPALNNTTIGQFSTTATPSGRTFQYSLVPGTGSTNNAQFTVSTTGALQTGSTFTSSLQSTYSILARTTDANFPSSYLTQQFTLDLIQAPTALNVSQSSVPNLANTAFAQFTTTSPQTGRTFQYALVPGTGSTDNALFTINPSTGQISTSSGFPLTGQTTFTVRVQTTDSQFSGLSYQQSFTFTLVTAPTNITASASSAPALASTQVAQLTTTGPSGQTYQYSLVSGTGFTIDPTTGVLSTAATGFPTSGPVTVTVQAANTQFPGLYVDVPLTFGVVTAPTSLQVSNGTFAPNSNLVIGTVSVPASSETYQYSLVSGTGSTNNSDFVIDPTTGVLSTAAGFPTTAPTSYSVRIQVTDTQFPGLTYSQALTLSAVPPPATPDLILPSQVSGVPGTATVLNLSSTPGDSTSVVSLTVSGVPSGVTFSAGTNDGGGTWTFTQAQLAGLTLTAPAAASFDLSVVATASFISGTPGTSTATGTLAVAIQTPTPVVVSVPVVAPTIAVAAPATFNPQSPLTLSVTTTDSVPETVQSVTVNWGDGTVQTFAGAPGSYTHQYAVSDTTYSVVVSVTDQNGTFTVPGPTTVTAALPTAQQGVVAALYLDLLGRSADAGGLASFSAQLTAGTPVSQVVSEIVESTEYQVNVLNGLYEKYLNRPVDSVGVAAFLPLLQSSGQEAVAAAILGSAEFYADAGGTNQGFVEALYQDVLGRTADAGGLANDLAALSFGASRQQVALGLLASPEEARDVVEQAYQTYLGRPADPAGLQVWEQAYLNDPATFLVSFLNSAEFAQRASTPTTAPVVTNDGTPGEPIS